MHAGGDAEFAHVVAVAVAVLVAAHEVERLSRVPGHAVGPRLHHQFADGRVHAEVVESDRTVAGCTPMGSDLGDYGCTI